MTLKGRMVEIYFSCKKASATLGCKSSDFFSRIFVYFVSLPKTLIAPFLLHSTIDEITSDCGSFFSEVGLHQNGLFFVKHQFAM